MADPIFIDDRDSKIVFFGVWFDVSSGNAALFDNTLKSTAVISSGYSYTFTGTAISVFGTVRQNLQNGLPPVSTYKLDGNDPVTYRAANVSAEGDGLLFFSASNLAAGTHQLVVNATQATGDNPYFLDYLTYVPVAQAAPAPSSTPKSTPSPSPTPSPTPTSQAQQSPSPTPTPTPSTTPPSQQSTQPAANKPSSSPAPQSSQASSSQTSQTSQTASSSGSGLASAQASSTPLTPGGSSSGTSTSPAPATSSSGGAVSVADNASVRSTTPVGAIAGGVIGGVALLALILFGLWFWCRKRRDAPGGEYFEQEKMIETRPPPRTDGVTPYMLPRDYNNSGAHVVPVVAGPSQEYSPPHDHTTFSPRKEFSPEYPSSFPAYGPTPTPPESSLGGASVNGSGSGSRTALVPAGSSSGRSESEYPATEAASQVLGGIPGAAVWVDPEHVTDEKKRPLSPARQLPSPPPPPRPPVMDSGMRFPSGVGPRSDYAMSEVPSVMPPAYTAR